VKYCITGGLGVIGSCITRSRVKEGDMVAVVDDGQDARHVLNGDAIGAEIHGAKLGEFTLPALPSCDRLLHAAASTGIPYSGAQPLDDWTRNVDGTLEVLTHLRKSERPVPTVVLSSVKPYGLAGLYSMEREGRYELSGSGVSEAAPLEPDEVYAASKAAQSMVCRAYARTYGLPLVVFRCSNLYGPAAPHGARHGWLTWLCIRAALGWTIEIQGSGKQTRDMLFWSDVLSAAKLAWAALEAGTPDMRGEIFNLGGGSDNMISVLEAVAQLRSLGARFEVKYAPGREHEDMLFVTDTTKFRERTGWVPQVRVGDGIAQIYEWACANRDALAEVYAEDGP
jgi:CDP-paratose 2-epimerase